MSMIIYFKQNDDLQKIKYNDYLQMTKLRYKRYINYIINDYNTLLNIFYLTNGNMVETKCII